MYEWKVIKYLIDTQRHRNIQEILFEHHHEPMESSLAEARKTKKLLTTTPGQYSLGQIIFRRIEQEMQRNYYRFGSIYISLVFVCISVLQYIYNYSNVKYIWCFGVFIALLSLLSILVLADMWYFVRVYFLMKQYHDYEFKRNKNILISQMLIVLIAFTSVAAFGFLFID